MGGIAFVGTSSNCGKTVIAALFLYHLWLRGVRASPFKAQNMSLNSYPAINGGEIALAQAMQAYAAHVEPLWEMNPVLLKPIGDCKSEVILGGKAIGVMSFLEYWRGLRDRAFRIADHALRRLLLEFDTVVLEGAGSVCEPNFVEGDFANLAFPHKYGFNAVLIADIERGGAFASIIGALKILPPRYRRLIKGVLINKFRGDLEILRPALDWLRGKTGLRVIGVLPYIEGLNLWPEDSEDLRGFGEGDLDIAVIAYPGISNFVDLESLKLEKDVSVRIVRSRASLGDPDVIMLLGSRNVFQSLKWLKDTGLDEAIKRRAGSSVIIGICGGFQILCRLISDPYGIESGVPMHAKGLGIFDVEVRYGVEKIVAQSKAVMADDGLCPTCGVIKGYEIRRGRPFYTGRTRPFLIITERNGVETHELDGAYDEKLMAYGMSLHMAFDNTCLRECLLNKARNAAGLPQMGSKGSSFDLLYKSLSDAYHIFKSNVDVDLLEALL